MTSDGQAELMHAEISYLTAHGNFGVTGTGYATYRIKALEKRLSALKRQTDRCPECGAGPFLRPCARGVHLRYCRQKGDRHGRD